DRWSHRSDPADPRWRSPRCRPCRPASRSRRRGAPRPCSAAARPPPGERALARPRPTPPPDRRTPGRSRPSCSKGPCAHHSRAMLEGMALAQLLPRAGEPLSSDEILDRFVGHAQAAGLELYPAQEEAILELLSGKHVILNTPTG